MKGWCPVHDRVVDAPDGDCPECGTALVPVDDEEREPTIVPVAAPEDEPVVEPIAATETSPEASRWAWGTQPATLATVVVGAILAAFLIGLDAGAPNVPDSSRFRTPNASSDLSVNRVDRGQVGIALRLDSFTQRGRRIVMRVSVSSTEPIPIGNLQTAQVEFFGAGGTSTGVMTSLPVRVTTTGFIVDGVALETAAIPVAAVQIDSLTFSAPDEGRMPLDLSGIWPPDRNGSPRTKRSSTSMKLGQRTFIVRSLVSWLDRIEVRIEVRGAKESWNYDDDFSLVIGNIERRSGRVIPTGEEHPNIVHVVFDAPRRLGEKPGIIIDHNHLELVGGWRWDVGSR